MFGSKSHKRIKELEKQLEEATKDKNSTEVLKQHYAHLISEIETYRTQIHELKEENNVLKSKLTRKKK